MFSYGLITKIVIVGVRSRKAELVNNGRSKGEGGWNHGAVGRTVGWMRRRDSWGKTRGGGSWSWVERGSRGVFECLWFVCWTFCVLRRVSWNGVCWKFLCMSELDVFELDTCTPYRSLSIRFFTHAAFMAGTREA